MLVVKRKLARAPQIPNLKSLSPIKNLMVGGGLKFLFDVIDFFCRVEPIYICTYLDKGLT